MLLVECCLRKREKTWNIKTIRVECCEVDQTMTILVGSSCRDFTKADLMKVWRKIYFNFCFFQLFEILLTPPSHQQPRCQQSTWEHPERTSSPSGDPCKSQHGTGDKTKLFDRDQIESTCLESLVPNHKLSQVTKLIILIIILRLKQHALSLWCRAALVCSSPSADIRCLGFPTYIQM